MFYEHAQARRENPAYYRYRHSPELPMDWVTELPTPPTHTRHTPVPTHTVSRAQYRPNTPGAPTAPTVSKASYKLNTLDVLPAHTASTPQALPTTTNTLPIMTAVHGSAPAHSNIGYEPTHIVNVAGHAIPMKQILIPITLAVTTTTDSTTTTTTVSLNTATTPAIIPTPTLQVQQETPTPPEQTAPATTTKRVPTTDPQASTQGR